MGPPHCRVEKQIPPCCQHRGSQEGACVGLPQSSPFLRTHCTLLKTDPAQDKARSLQGSSALCDRSQSCGWT